jgi:DNA-binding HxlR family transcriptional regulator
VPDTGFLDALGEAATRAGDRWSLLVVAALLEGPLRFKELLAAVEGIAPNVLAQRLRQLEADGIVVAEPYSTRPPRHLYELTQTGSELAGALGLLAAWGAAVSGRGEPPRHGVCGTPLEARPWCPTCRTVVEADQRDEVDLV